MATQQIRLKTCVAAYRACCQQRPQQQEGKTKLGDLPVLESTWVLLFLNWQINLLAIVTSVRQLHLVSRHCNRDCTSRPHTELLGTGREMQTCTCQARFSAPRRVTQGLQCDLPSWLCPTTPSLKDSKGQSPTKALRGSKEAL